MDWGLPESSCLSISIIARHSEDAQLIAFVLDGSALTLIAVLVSSDVGYLDVRRLAQKIDVDTPDFASAVDEDAGTARYNGLPMLAYGGGEPVGLLLGVERRAIAAVEHMPRPALIDLKN